MPFEILNPLEVTDWNEQVKTFSEGSVFHSAEWAGVLMEAYGYRPFYAALREEGGLKGVIPVLEVDSRVTGRRGVSLPFTDLCPPLVPNKETLEDLFRFLVATGERRGWRYLELRGEKVESGERSIDAAYYHHRLSLKNGVENLFGKLSENHRRNIRKAEKEGVRVDILADEAAMEDFIRLNIRTRRLHGLPPQPHRFFEELFRRVIDQNMGFISLADYRGEKVAGAVFLLFGKKAVYKYGASDERYLRLRANHLVMWKGIQWLADQGFQELDFGRTDIGQEGLRRFKQGWKAEESLIRYRRFDLKTKLFQPVPLTKNRIAGKVFGRMPYPILTFIGRLAYRHMG